ncbi:MAG: transposase [Sulfuricurvum sp.]|nr:transposase [Sulfuricurvum sp.]
MPRRPRVELSGFHHIINRGVNKSEIYMCDEDYDMFLIIVCKACKNYRVILHDYCLMSNHYHLLIESELENLSLFMKHINSNYAIYVNKKYKRSGHFWQGRFYSRYINDEAYFYTLVKYIEHNPIEVGMAQNVGEYPYTLLWALKNKTTPIECSLHSKLIDEIKYIDSFIGLTLNEEDIKTLHTIEKQKVLLNENMKSLAYTRSLDSHFKDISTKLLRDTAIHYALKDGYTQAQIARHLGISRARISQIIKKSAEMVNI